MSALTRLFCLAAILAAATPLQADEPLDPERLVEQLGSDQFADREAATRDLQRMGRPAIPHLVRAVRQGDFETQRRALSVLCALAASDDSAEAVFDALSDLADDDNRPVQAVAQEALDNVRTLREAAAVEELRAQGADVDLRSSGRMAGTSVRFGPNWQGSEKLVGLLSRIHDLNSVSLEDTRLGDAAMETISELPRLRWLYLGNSRVTGKGLARLDNLQQLQHLSLRNLPLKDDEFLQLPPLASLQALGLDGTRITNDGLKHLADFPGLRTLWLDRTQITSEGFVELSSLKDLAVLYASETKISGPGLAELRKLPQLRSISLKRCQLAPEDLDRLSGLEQLDMLGLDHTNVTDEHLVHLTNLPKLRTLWLSQLQDVTDDSVEHLQQFTSLRTLYLHASGVSEHGADKLKRALSQCQVYR